MRDVAPVDYQLLFQSLPGACLILQAGEPFVIVDVNDAFLRSTEWSAAS